jgi:hypothetical protein
LELSDEFVADNGIKVLNENMLMTNNRFSSIHISLIHGYPCSKNKQTRAYKTGSVFNSRAYSYASVLSDQINDWVKHGKDKEVHTCMRYGVKSDRNIPTSPKGMSGGGLWLLPDLLSPTDFYLDSILIEFYKNEKITFSTKIEKIVDFIKSEREEAPSDENIVPFEAVNATS